MVDFKKGQEGHQAEQEQVLEGIKVVETVVKRMEGLEKVESKQSVNRRLLLKNQERIDETEQNEGDREATRVNKG